MGNRLGTPQYQYNVTPPVTQRPVSPSTGVPKNFNWVIPNQLATSGLPRTQTELVNLAQNGFRLVVSLTETPLPAHIRTFTESQMPTMHVPVNDGHIPTLGQMERMTSALHTTIAAGGAGLSHCHEGIGRSVLLATCYLVRYRGMKPDQAISFVRQIQTRALCSGMGARNLLQEQFVYDFYNLMCRRGGSRHRSSSAPARRHAAAANPVAVPPAYQVPQTPQASLHPAGHISQFAYPQPQANQYTYAASPRQYAPQYSGPGSHVWNTPPANMQPMY